MTETEAEVNSIFAAPATVEEGDRTSGYIYVLSTLSQNPDLASIPNLYKIGFTTTIVEERIANAENEPTYLMAGVRIEASYRIVNMHSHRFETILHQVLGNVQLDVAVCDNNGMEHHPKEWFQVPLSVVNTIVQRICDGTITKYVYNATLQCLERCGQNFQD